MNLNINKLNLGFYFVNSNKTYNFTHPNTKSRLYGKI